MKTSLLRRMALLVTCGLFLSMGTAINADYPYITSITRNGDYVSVTVAVPPYIPSGYAEAKYIDENYFWWMDQNRAASLDHNMTVNAFGYTNACVYVYSVDGQYSYAIHDTTTGAYISNGP